MWHLDDLIEHATHNHRKIDGGWCPCRPEIGPFRKRLIAAWAVLTGKADAVIWPNGQ